MIIRSVASADVASVADSLLSAFEGDPLISFLFGARWSEEQYVAEFFRILLSVRVSLGMPAYCAATGEGIIGAAMGYDASRPTWHDNHLEEWTQLMGSVDGLESRLEAYGQLAERFEPADPHFYLGVIGVRCGRKGGGVGRALLDRFCDSSEVDAESSGVYLETASEKSLGFYLKNGFELRGEGSLGVDTRLWCVFKGTGHGTVA